MKSPLKKLAPFVLALFVFAYTITFIPYLAGADFGDFGGDSDYGSSWDSDYSSDWGSSWDDDDDYSYSSSGSSSYSSDGSDPGGLLELLLGLAIFFGVPILVIRNIIKSISKSSKSSAKAPGASATTGLLPLLELYTTDPNFSEDDLRRRLSNLYVQMQSCWQAKDITPLRSDFTDEQYAQFDRQLQRYRDTRQTNIIDRIAVLDVSLRGIKPSPQHDVLIANMRTRVVDYVIDDTNEKIIRGSNTAEKFMEYEWTLIRPKGAKTQKQTGDSAFNCPNCAAPMDINRSAKCPYCGNVVSKSDFDWVISQIKGLSQTTK